MENFKEKISKAREIAQDPRVRCGSHTAYQTLLRRISIYVSYFLCRLGITANQVTVFMGLCSIIGGLCYFPRNIYVNIAGILLIQLDSFLDLVDGEVARLRNESSVVGVYLDFAAHQTGIPLFALGFGMHLYFLDRSVFTLLMTLLFYSIFHLHRAMTTTSRAALFAVGYKGSPDWKRDKTANKRTSLWPNIFVILGRSLFTSYATTLTGVCLVASYFAGTTILYMYLITYTILAALALMSMILRDILKLNKIGKTVSK